MTKQTIRCAIYTRKSTEEGLDQAFNSLDAQREACQAYVLSQAGEGWTAVRDHYDDGGFTGGNMDRPALQKLLADIDRGLIDVVVVYKIDRLTRSLADFAKIVERLEKRNASFVSVTQAFNTTTSMGRLTLNVLLSFAQFEREVTAERIRDKFSASRRKGIFMGGCPPLGYDARDRKLVINPAEAETVRFIFKRYLELGAVATLRAELDAKDITTKAWVSTRGKAMGGGCWYIGPLRHILHNRVYVGEAVHKGIAFPGEHGAIVPRDLFDAVQAKLDSNRSSHCRKRTVGRMGLLTGLLFDARGNAMSPSKSRRPDGRSYLYYISQARIQRREPDAMRPIPAHAIEGIVQDRVSCITHPAENRNGEISNRSAETGLKPEPTQSRELLRELLTRVEIGADHVAIKFRSHVVAERIGVRPKRVVDILKTRLPDADRLEETDGILALTIPIRIPLRGGAKVRIR
jgi:DNA invertase Pin-like site-specific DNA recombinase